MLFAGLMTSPSISTSQAWRTGCLRTPGAHPVPAADDQDVLRLRVAGQSRMDEHFMVVGLVPSSFDESVQEQNVAIGRVVDDLDRLEPGPAPVQDLADREDADAGV
jgi:hypothetical protein